MTPRRRERRSGDGSMLGSLLLLLFTVGALADGSDYGRWKREQADRRADGIGGDGGGRGFCTSSRGLVFGARQKPTAYKRRSTLSYCTRYYRNTCCNRTHTDALRLRDRAVLAARFSSACRASADDLQIAARLVHVGRV